MTNPIKKSVIILTLAILFTNHSSAEELTFEETQDFFANPKKIYNEEHGQYYDSVNMHELWEKAGIAPKPTEEQYLYYPETKLYSGRNLKALRVHGSLLTGCQFLLFKKSGNEWIYFNRIDVDNQKYNPPEIGFLNDALFYVTAYAMSGNENVYYIKKFYTINDKNIKQLLVCPGKGYVQNWGMIFNRDFKSRLDYSDDTLTIEYTVDISANTDYYKPNVDNAPSTFPLFTAVKTVVFNWNGQELLFDENVSQLTLDNMNGLFMGGYVEYYDMFKKEFDQLKQSNEMRREWYKVFIEQVKQVTEAENTPQSKGDA